MTSSACTCTTVKPRRLTLYDPHLARCHGSVCGSGPVVPCCGSHSSDHTRTPHPVPRTPEGDLLKSSEQMGVCLEHKELPGKCVIFCPQQHLVLKQKSLEILD